MQGRARLSDLREDPAQAARAAQGQPKKSKQGRQDAEGQGAPGRLGWSASLLLLQPWLNPNGNSLGSNVQAAPHHRENTGNLVCSSLGRSVASNQAATPLRAEPSTFTHGLP